jgi:hypothetical protein
VWRVKHHTQCRQTSCYRQSQDRGRQTDSGQGPKQNGVVIGTVGKKVEKVDKLTPVTHPDTWPIERRMGWKLKDLNHGCWVLEIDNRLIYHLPIASTSCLLDMSWQSTTPGLGLLWWTCLCENTIVITSNLELKQMLPSSYHLHYGDVCSLSAILSWTFSKRLVLFSTQLPVYIFWISLLK